jgi:hypothetical protein
LVKATAETFQICEIAADKAYLDRPDLELVEGLGRDALHPVQVE